jgi:HlyD family secretion protein
VEEGDRLAAGLRVGSVETTSLELERAQLVANRRASASRTAAVAAQVAVLAEQRRLAAFELARLERLAADRAATPQQLDRGKSALAVLDRQIRQAATQDETIAAELSSFDAQIARLDDRIANSPVENPIDGTVLTRYAEAHELVAAGQPLYDIADLSSLELRAYASGAQLPRLALGQRVEVAIDEDKKSDRTLPGTISWIASQAEFTPSTVQTKEERVDLVYAFKVRVANPEGRIKIGMPGEVRLAAPASPAEATGPAR